jgi:hypothetical protein
MMAFIEIYGPERHVSEEEENGVNPLWEQIIQNHASWDDIDIEVLYLTYHPKENVHSLLVDFKDIGDYELFKSKYLDGLKPVSGITHGELIKPVFFTIPKGTPMEYKRYAVTITADPIEYENLYSTLSQFKPGENIIISYLTYLREIGKDILLSVVAKDSDEVEKFISESIKPLKGVQFIKTIYISRTKRLISKEKWHEIVKPYSDSDKDSEDDDKGSEIEPWEYNEKFVCC